jgi:hypothetical protein
MSQKLAHYFVVTGIGVQVDLCGQMPELVRRDLYPNASQHGALDGDTQCR